MTTAVADAMRTDAVPPAVDGCDNEAILLLTGRGEAPPAFVDAMTASGAVIVTADRVPAAEIVRTHRIVAIVTTVTGLRALDVEDLLRALDNRPAWYATVVIAVGVDRPADMEQLARLDMHATVVPVEARPDDRFMASLAMAAIRGHRCSRQHVERCERAEQAAYQLAETFEARVEKRTVELASALNICSVASAQLTETDERNRAVIEMSDLIMFTADAEGNLVRVDDRFFEVTGFDRDTPMSISSDKSRVHPDDRERVRLAQIEAVRSGKPANYEYRGALIDGSYRWWQLRAGPVLDANGTVLRWNGTMVDVHDRKVAEERLRESELRHRVSTELSNLVTFTLTADGKLSDLDEHFSTLVGLPIAGLLADGLESIWHPADLREMASHRAAALISRSFDVTSRLRHGDGNYHWWRTRLAAQCDADNNIVGWFGTMKDVDLLVTANEQLKRSEEGHRLSVEFSDQIVWSAKADGTVETIADTIFDRIGIPRHVWMAMSSAARAHPDDAERIEAIIGKAQRDRKPTDYKFRLRYGDGSYRWWRLRSAPLLDGDGGVVRWHGVLEDVDQLHRAEERLRESEERYRFAIQLSNLVTYTATPEGRIATMDDITSSATGFSVEEILTNGSDFTWHPDHLDRIRAGRAEAAVTGQYDQTCLMDNRDGTYKWWRSRAAPYRDADGKIICWHGTLENVDELKRATERLRESEDRHRFCIGLSNLVTYTATPAGVIESIDDALFADTGISVADVVGGGPTNYCHPDDIASLELAITNAFMTGKLDINYRMHDAGGTYRWWRSRAQPRRDESGNIVRWYGTLEDVDDLRRAEERLRASEDRHRFCIGLSKLITYTTTATGKVVSIDDAIEAATGVTAETIVGGSPLRGCHPDDIACLQAAHLAAANGGAFDHCYRIQDADGGYRWWRSRSQPRYDEAGNITLRYGTLEDIDDLRRAEERLRDSEALHRFSLQLSDLVVWSATPDGIITDVGDRLYEVAGVTRKELFSGRMRDWLHPDEADRVLALRNKCMADGAPADFPFRMRKANGDYYWWRWRSAPQRDADGNIVRWYGTLENIDDLRRAEELLRGSEELHRHSVELSNLIVWTADNKGRFLSVSPRIFKVLGLTREMTPTLRPISLVHQDDLASTAAALQAGLGEGKSADIRLRLRVADGSYRWWRLRSSPLRDANGDIIRWYGTMEDADELIRAEERLRESEELHRFSVELGNQVVWTGTAEGRLLSVGPRLLEKIGFGAESTLWARPDQLVHRDDQDAASAARRASIREGKPADFQCRVMHRDGEYHWWRVRAAPLRDANGVILRWYGTLEDIDALRRAGEQLRETEELYRYTVELGNAIVITAAADGNVTSIGSRWTDVTGVSLESMLGRGLFKLIHPDERAAAAATWAACVADGTGLDHVARVADAAGEYRWWRVRAAQRRGSAGEPIGWYGTLEDVDATTRAELQLQQLQAEMVHLSRLNAMGTMASTLAHELNQPLAAVINYIAGCRRLLAGATGPSAQRIEAAMRSAQDCAVRAADIIRRVRQQVSRGDANHCATATASVIQDACSIALISAHELGIELVIDLDPRADTIHVDSIQVQQVLINLLRNAAEAVAERPVRKIAISTRLAGDQCALSVDDTGPGVSEAILERLFEPFETSKATGMGIGLSISRTIAESHGGKIDYRRSDLGGACFTMLLPLSPPAT